MNFNTIDFLNDWDIEESDWNLIPKGDIPCGMNDELCQDYIGQTIRIKSNTRYWSCNTLSNPRDTDGIITRFKRDHMFVTWVNGYTNSYTPSDLIIV